MKILIISLLALIIIGCGESDSNKLKEISGQLKKDSCNINLLKKRAGLYIKNGEVEKSYDDVKKILELDSNDISGNVMKGHYCYDKHNWDEMINTFRKVTKLKPGYASSYWFMAVGYHEKKNYDLAIDDIDKFIQLKKDPEDNIIKASFCFAAGRYNEALKLFKHLSKESNDKVHSLYNEDVSKLYLLIDKPDSALLYINKIIKKNNRGNDYLLYERGVIYYYMNEYDKARMELNESIKMDNNNAYAYYFLSSIEGRSANKKKMLDYLSFAAAKGFEDHDMVDTNRVFEQVKHTSLFKKCMSSIRKNSKIFDERVNNSEINGTIYSSDNKFIEDKMKYIYIIPNKTRQYVELYHHMHYLSR